ncbi:MAG: magnesium/cobalt transporter CorA [Planctomycetota bacterium]|nr:magnesium/cobalt transporter CorA [Planctomycetota bacterium]MDA1166388.1 magnesium/cobalt transporter CorA [Planctomycetota bacterium]
MSDQKHAGRHVRRAMFRRRTEPGAAPGSIETDPNAHKPEIRILSFGPDELKEEPIPGVSRVESILRRRPITWVNITGLGDSRTIHELGRIFKLHPLALEDVVNVHQQPKAEFYDGSLFLVTRIPIAGERFETEQISIFVGDHYVLTFQERPGDCFEPVRERLRESRGRIRSAGPDYLAYSLLDSVVDAWFPIIERYGDTLDDIDREITEQHTLDAVSRLHAIRHELVRARRLFLRQREALGIMRRTDESTQLVKPETRIYLRDCQDHTTQIIDAIDAFREMCSDLREFHFSQVTDRTNETMRVLTVIATIFIPLSFFTGLWGMNFDSSTSPWNMPELEWQLGYPFALGLMASVAGVMLLYFWRKGWLR